MTGRPTSERIGAIVGCLLVLAALIIIWMSRLSIDHDVYVSELGAPDLATARPFEIALLLIVAGASLIALAGRDLRSRVRWLAMWTPAVSLWISSGFFLIASQVTCTPGCPVPVGATFTWQDFIHTSIAVLAFASACVAMVQVAFARGHRGIARMSLVAAVVVAVVAGAGGILSLAHFQQGFGSRLELTATTVALGWLVALGLSLAVGRQTSAAPAPHNVEHLVGEVDEHEDLVLVPIDPAALRVSGERDEGVVLLPDEKRALRSENILLPPDLA